VRTSAAGNVEFGTEADRAILWAHWKPTLAGNLNENNY